MMNLEGYRIFLHTARAGNLTKAAQELHITQPSVSYAIKQMEDALGVKLFHRLSKGVELTAEGRALLEYVEPSFSLLEAGENKVRSLKRLEAGELRIGAGGSLIRHLLLPYLDRFHTQYPDVRIRLSHGKTPDLAKRLIDGQIDLGIVHMPFTDRQLDVRPLITIEDCFVVGEAYRHMAERILAAEELLNLPLLLLSRGSSTREFVEQWFAAQGMPLEVDIELGSLELLIELARLGFGAAFVTRSFVKKELEAGSLYELRIREPIPSRSVGIALRRDISLSEAASRFVETLTSPPSELSN
ncbi:LysR family transcriptional regulator [Paenibacillus sp. J2TS4]|uniref:LysR family transcriptional regulator n=1 Tax=Paenibacillus sp. J2TS4 TaxID=2807194 RepID=UPI001BCB707A|nr:LysR family transcriptional regulator [Paenibacillus sp. J2TS4]